ncbi:MAG: CxxxxCH/CxxCH domain-containing protein, partial [Desulfuromonadales bacterium]|nr:CxxxxCH/CxxCH domain-containing protein [Desulfuromonadales bacterium]
MKLKLIVGRLLILTVALSLLFSALPVVAADGPLLHNSNRFSGTTKHGGSWGLPGTKYGEFSCATCHDRNTGNIKRVRNTLPSAPDTGSGDFPGAGASITFQDVRANSSDFGDDGRALKTESNNICEVCHSYDAAQLTGVKFHGYDMSGPGDVGHYNKADCITCHPHSQGFKPLACDSCHGNPPTVATAGGPNGFADNPYSTGSATVGAHTAHAVTQSLACTNCHDGYNMPQESTANPGFGDISISFNNYGSVTGSYTGQSGVSYNDGLGAGGQTCNTVYCHSNGQSADGTSATPSAYSAPTWSGGAACGSCHSDTDPATGSHTEHIGAGAVCNDCHSGNTHVDRVIDVTVGAYTAGGAPGNNYGTCSTASCHDDGTGSPATTQDWGTTINDCSECHGNVPGTGAHAKHFAAVGTLIDAFDCSDCHKDATKGGSAPTGGEHRDGNIDVYNSNPDVGGGTTDLGYATDVATTSPGYATETCNTSYCHGDNMPKGTTSGNTNAPTWGATSTGCTFCHDMAPAAIGAHAGKTLTQCIDCHGPGSGSVNASGTGFTNGGATHMDGTVQGGGDNCTDCHAADIDDTKNGVHASHTDVATLLAGKTVTGNDYGNASWWYTTTWVSGAPKFGCGECHPAGEGTGHPVSGLNVDIDPGGESPSAGSPKLKNTNSPSTPTMTSRTS